MNIIETLRYKNELKQIALYIKKDKKSAAIKFVKEQKELINNLVNFPFKYKKSIYFDDENIRDMTFYGYTIIYEIDEKNETIIIYTIFNKNLPNIWNIKESI